MLGSVAILSLSELMASTKAIWLIGVSNLKITETSQPTTVQETLSNAELWKSTRPN
jgi:hypothetical protein